MMNQQDQEYDAFIELTSYLIVNQADMARMLLESEEIECYLINDKTSTAIPVYAPAIGGIGLMVRQSQAERAWQILFENNLVSETQGESMSQRMDNLIRHWYPRKYGQWTLWAFLGVLLGYAILIAFGWMQPGSLP